MDFQDMSDYVAGFADQVCKQEYVVNQMCPPHAMLMYFRKCTTYFLIALGR